LPSLSFHRLEKLGNVDGAMRCYREALADSPEEETARTRLDILTAAAEKKVCLSVCVHGGSSLVGCESECKVLVAAC